MTISLGRLGGGVSYRGLRRIRKAGTRPGMVCHLATGFHPALISDSHAHTEDKAPQRSGLEQKQDNS